MKKLIFAILLMLFSIVGFSQNNPYQQQKSGFVPDPSQIPTLNITLNQVQNGWALIGNSCHGCASYWYQVLRSQQMHQAEDGQYYYYFYFNFFSNSRYANGQNAGTYLNQLNFYYNGNHSFSVPYILVPSGQTVWGAWMRSQNSNSSVSFTVAQITVY
jgi:hypothetical protein